MAPSLESALSSYTIAELESPLPPLSWGRPTRDRCAMSMSVFRSVRADKRGHYPAGRRRSTLTARQQNRARRYLNRILRLGYSLNKIGKVLDRDPKVLARWLSGKCWPTQESRSSAAGIQPCGQKATDIPCFESAIGSALLKVSTAKVRFKDASSAQEGAVVRRNCACASRSIGKDRA
jgi:hypothetical protein